MSVRTRPGLKKKTGIRPASSLAVITIRPLGLYARSGSVLENGPKTAAEIAEATGISQASASTTLSKLAESGDVVEAERGYKLPE
jgi:Fic family protein